MRLVIQAEIVQRYFPESEIIWNYGADEGWALETRDGYTIPIIDIDDHDDNEWAVFYDSL